MSALIDNITNILTAPREAFAALRERPTFLVPMLALILGNCALIVWYYSEVDIAWLMETSLQMSGREVPPEVLEQTRRATENIPRAAFGASAAVSSALVIVIVLLLMAGYLAFVSMLANDGFRFRQWLSLVSWSSFPVVFGVIASAVNLAVSNITFLLATEINPLTLASIFGTAREGGGMLRSMLQYVDVTSLWSLGLMTYGYRLWTGKPLALSFAIVAAPLAVIVAISLLLSAL